MYDLTIFLNFLFLQNIQLPFYNFVKLSYSDSMSFGSLGIFLNFFNLNKSKPIFNFYKHCLVSFKTTELNPSFSFFTTARVKYSNKNFLLLNTFFFYKVVNQMINVLLLQLYNKMNFFIFSEYNYMQNFFNILKYTVSYKFNLEFDKVLGFTKRLSNYYYLHSTLHILHYNYNVYTLIVVNDMFTKYNLHALRSSQFILVGVVDGSKNYHNYDYTIFFKKLTFEVIYSVYCTFISLYFMYFLQAKWFFFFKYVLLYTKNKKLII